MMIGIGKFKRVCLEPTFQIGFETFVASLSSAICCTLSQKAFHHLFDLPEGGGITILRIVTDFPLRDLTELIDND